MKRLYISLLCIFVIVAMSGCSKGTVYTSTKQGFGGDVVVEMEVKDGVVSSVSIKGDHETPNLGGKAITTISDSLAQNVVGKTIQDASSTQIDVVSGATITSTAVSNAYKEVVSEGLGGDVVQKPVSDSNNTYKADGMSIKGPMSVRVELKDNKINDIEVVDHSESDSYDGEGTSHIFETAKNNLIPRILESQSLDVDVITGATMSSSAIKNAVAQAIDSSGGDSSQWYKEIPMKDETIKLEGYDVIVVGLGGSGSIAYTSAAENGASVFGIEATAKIGGQSATVSGPMAINSKNQMENNNGEKFVEEEELIKDWVEYTKGDAKEDILREFVFESGNSIDWLMDNYNFTFSDMLAFTHPKGWQTWAVYTMDKTEAFTNMIDEAKAMNEKNDFVLETKAESLIVDGGKIVGVKAKKFDGSTYEVYGDSVILATGGFIGNSTMKIEYLGENKDFAPFALTTDNGAGIKMAQEVNADTYNIDMDAMVHIAQVKNIIKSQDLNADQKAVLTSLVLNPESMIVGTDGKRFMNESGNVNFDAFKGGDTYYAIYTKEQMDKYTTEGMTYLNTPVGLPQGGELPSANTPIADIPTILEVGKTHKNVVYASSIEELAGLINVDSKTLSESATSYSTDTVDAFGKDKKDITSLENSEGYYAVIGSAYAYGTCGGLLIDFDFNVIDQEGTVIENLYAVGQDSLGVILSNQVEYVSYGGAAQGWTLTSGRLAGRNAAIKFSEN